MQAQTAVRGTTRKAYVITKRECQKAIDERGNVCSYCGRDIVAIKTVDNANNPTYWPGCLHGTTAGNFGAGVPKDVFELAEKLICSDELGWRHLHKAEYWTTPESRLHWFQSQVSGMCSNIQQMEYLKTNPARKTKEEFLNDKY